MMGDSLRGIGRERGKKFETFEGGVEDPREKTVFVANHQLLSNAIIEVDYYLNAM